MKSSNRLRVILISLMLLPLLITGILVSISAWIYISSDLIKMLFTHWIVLLLVSCIVISCIAVAFTLSRRLAEQLTFLTNAAQKISQGQSIHQVQEHHLYSEFRLLYQYLVEHTAFHDDITNFVKETTRGSSDTSLQLRSEDDDFIKALNVLLTRLHNIHQVIKAISERDLTFLQSLDETDLGSDTSIHTMIAELTDLSSKARDYTDQIVRTGSQINSITSQGLQDTKIVTKRIHDISQSIHKMALNIQHVAEHLQGQSFILDDTSASIEHTMNSVEEIAQNVTELKELVEKDPLTSEVSEQTTFALDRMHEMTKTIKRDTDAGINLSQGLLEEVGKGEKVMQQAIEGIRRIQDSMHDFFTIIRRLGDRSEEVSETLEVISDIADHTNLLAINAAIISAHAGEHGRDFAVIADEIGKFAERTRESTDEIEDLLRTIQDEFQTAIQAMGHSSKAISDGVEFSRNAGSTFDNISENITETNTIIARIAEVTAEQLRENDHIRRMLAELGQFQDEKHGQITNALWQLTQTISQIRGITSEQAEGSARIAVMAEKLDQLTKEISQATGQHVTAANQIVEAVMYIQKLIQRTTLGTEKAAQLSNELFTIGGNLAFTIGEFALSATPEQPVEKGVPLIGFVRRGSGTFFDFMLAGIREESRQYGFDILETNSHYEATIQVENVNWLLRQPMLQGVILCPTDANVAQKLVQKGNIQGIPFVAADETIPTTLTVRSGNREGGRRAAELFIKHLNPNAAVGVIVDRTVESMARRALGFRQKAEQYPLDIVEIYCDITTPEKMKSYIVSAIEENLGLQGVFLTNEDLTTGYLNALHEGLLPTQALLAVGYDYTPLAENAIRAGELLGAIFQHPEEIGRQAFQQLHKLITQQIRLDELEERNLYIPTVQATKENLDSLTHQENTR